MKQKQVKARLKIHLLLGKKVTQAKVLALWRTTRLASYIFRLRREGMRIKSTIIRHGRDQYAEYQLE